MKTTALVIYVVVTAIVVFVAAFHLIHVAGKLNYLKNPDNFKTKSAAVNGARFSKLLTLQGQLPVAWRGFMITFIIEGIRLVCLYLAGMF